MKQEIYYIISNSDGDTRVVPMSKDELMQNLNEDGSGYKATDVMSAIDHMDTNYWDDGFLIIKGEIVRPEVVTEVTKWQIK